jgi:hypothetical protein
MKNQAMVRTQIYLTRREHQSLRRLAKRTGRPQSEIIRAAVDHWLEQGTAAGRAQILDAVAGLWRGRTDLPDFDALRREADRIPPARRHA